MRSEAVSSWVGDREESLEEMFVIRSIHEGDIQDDSIGEGDSRACDREMLRMVGFSRHNGCDGFARG